EAITRGSLRVSSLVKTKTKAVVGQKKKKIRRSDAQDLFRSIHSAYSATPTNLKIIDLYVVFAVFTALIQVSKVYDGL
ncbi:hypothetical protein HID58_067118, partial [Brassica napus]